MILFSLVAAIALAASSCALGNRLDMKTAADSDLTGSFDLILYGCTYHDDFETVAILAKEDGPYVFEPYAPDFNYRVVKGVPAKDALDQAQKFVDCHTAYHRAQLSRLVDAKGDTLGFEVRPLYHPFVFGVDDALDTDYRIKDGKVVVKIRLLPSIENMLSGGGSGRDKD
ncbi:MAG: hypothetical protein ACHQ0Y_05225 [Thermodesulfovibrionales bacterium]